MESDPNTYTNKFQNLHEFTYSAYYCFYKNKINRTRKISLFAVPLIYKLQIKLNIQFLFKNLWSVIKWQKLTSIFCSIILNINWDSYYLSIETECILFSSKSQLFSVFLSLWKKKTNLKRICIVHFIHWNCFDYIKCVEKSIYGDRTLFFWVSLLTI